MKKSAMKNIFSFSAICLALLSCNDFNLVDNSSMAVQSGYCVLPDKDVTLQIVRIAQSMLSNPMGTCTPFSIDNKNYQGCVEYHWDQVKGKHKGVTVYIECKSK